MSPRSKTGTSLAEALRAKGVRGVLVTMAEAGQLLDLACEMPQCYCPKGRRHFDERSKPPGPWSPNADHYPILKMAKGHLTPDNVRLAHVRCNGYDHGWRQRIKPLLARGMSLEEIAAKLNRSTSVPRPHGHSKWTAALVRRAYVS